MEFWKTVDCKVCKRKFQIDSNWKGQVYCPYCEETCEKGQETGRVF